MRHWQSPRRIGGRLDHGLYWIVLARGKSVAVVRNVVVIWSNFKLTSRCSRPHLYAPNIKLPDILIIRLTICLSSVTCGAQAVTRHIIDEFPLAARVVIRSLIYDAKMPQPYCPTLSSSTGPMCRPKNFIPKLKRKTPACDIGSVYYDVPQ